MFAAVPELLLGMSWPRSSAVRSAAVADFFGSVLGVGSGVADAMVLERTGDSLLCLVKDRVVLKPRVATRLAMMEESG